MSFANKYIEKTWLKRNKAKKQNTILNDNI